ncbi:hypothetical protein C1645_832005 [Glomus cerebriforme]|uniref:Uncharacterized protein n=1 Tax=Glomus cerebriforme TaxID=658196 RepID=A0A397SPQ3_9GLOM|nr:hypothetical protein C1645_832005 [Glomus cerebriforme]
MNFTHLYIIRNFDHRLITGAKRCFSEIEFLKCSTRINDNVLAGLIEICKLIKELELIIPMNHNNYGIIRLIEIPKKLTTVHFRYRENLPLPHLQILNGDYVSINVITSLIENTSGSLTKIKYIDMDYESLKLLFENWKGRHPMLLQIKLSLDFKDLIEKYKIS